MTSLIDKEIISNGGEFSSFRSDWVTVFYDQSNNVTSDDGSQTAYRAITRRGVKLWLVFSKDNQKGYRAASNCPFDAFQEAQDAGAEKRQMPDLWSKFRDRRRRRPRVEIVS